MTKRKARKKAPAKKKQDKKGSLSEDQEIEEEYPDVEETEQQDEPKQILKELSASDFPNVGELIVGTCTKITTHGAYFSIDGFEILGKSAGFVHISELSRTWVRNIRKHVREGQKSVCRVMRVNIQRQEIDLSIRRVTESQKRETLQQHKQEQRARGIIKSVADKLNIPEDSIFPTLEANFNSLYASLESARDDGPSELINIGLSDEISNEIASTASKELERSTVTLSGKIQISTYDPAGNELIKNAFNSASTATLKKNALGVQVNVISAPEYRAIINASDWKIAEKCWLTFQETIKKQIKKNSEFEPLILSFVRE